MKKLIIFLFAFISLFAVTAFAGEAEVKWISAEGNFSVYPFSEYGAASFRSDGKAGIIGSDGEIIVPAIYDNADVFSQGAYLVYSGGSKTVIRADGSLIFDASRYRSINMAKNGLSQVWIGEKAGIIGLSGEVILPCEYERIGFFSSGLIWAEKDGVYSLYSKDGSLIRTGYTSVENRGSDSLAAVGKDGAFGIIDRFGEEIVPLIYPGAMVCGENIAAVLSGGWKYVNSKGGIIGGVYFEYPGSFSEGLAPVLFEGKYGYVNEAGELVIGYKYDYASGFKNSMACVSDSEGSYIIDKNGNVKITAGEYGISLRFGVPVAEYWENSPGLGTPGSLKAILSDNGEFLTGFDYYGIGEFEDGAAIAVNKDGKYGLVKRTGEEITAFDFDGIVRSGRNKFMAYKEGKGAVITTAFAQSETTLTAVPFPVTVNGQRIDQRDEFPPLYLNGIVYLPTTYNMNSFVGLRVEFYPDRREGDKKAGSIFIGLDKITSDEYIPYKSETVEKMTGRIQNEIIAVNDCYASDDIKNTAREYPVVNCGNVLYLPLTYDIAAEKLDWKMEFSGEKGLVVDTRSPNRPVLDKMHSAVVGVSSAPKAVKPTRYVFSKNAYAGYPPNTFGNDYEFRYKEVGKDEVRFEIALSDADYSLNQRTVTGRDRTQKDCTPELSDDGIMTLHAVRSVCNEKGAYVGGENVVLTINMKAGKLLGIKSEGVIYFEK